MGGATYASEKLNSQASLKDLMLDIPEGMVSSINKSLDYHWKDLKLKLKSKKDEDYKTYFNLSSKNKKITIRAGYYLGYLIAKEIGETKSLSEMAQMNDEKVFPLIEAIVGRRQENE